MNVLKVVQRWSLLSRIFLIGTCLCVLFVTSGWILDEWVPRPIVLVPPPVGEPFAGPQVAVPGCPDNVISADLKDRVNIDDPVDVVVTTSAATKGATTDPKCDAVIGLQGVPASRVEVVPNSKVRLAFERQQQEFAWVVKPTSNGRVTLVVLVSSAENRDRLDSIKLDLEVLPSRRVIDALQTANSYLDQTTAVVADPEVRPRPKHTSFIKVGVSTPAVDITAGMDPLATLEVCLTPMGAGIKTAQDANCQENKVDLTKSHQYLIDLEVRPEEEGLIRVQSKTTLTYSVNGVQTTQDSEHSQKVSENSEVTKIDAISTFLEAAQSWILGLGGAGFLAFVGSQFMARRTEKKASTQPKSSVGVSADRGYL